MSAAETSPGSTAPARSRADTRRRLVDAGTVLFAEHGLHGVTSSAIARAAGVATGTFYLHFKDKHALFHEIAFAALAELRERQDRTVAEGTPAGIRGELRLRIEALLDFAAENRDLIRVVFGRGADAPAVGEEVLDELLPGIARRLGQRRAAGELVPGVHPDVAAQALLAMNVRVMAWWIDHPDAASREHVVSTLLALHPARPAQPA